ncbi:MAG: CBS domain-containing protein [Desulfomonilaceae bacterium]
METIRVKDLMTSFEGYPRVDEDASLYEAVQALEEGRQRLDGKGHRFMAVLVCDRSGNVIGKLNRMDILTCLEPEYLTNEELRKVSRFGLTPEFLHSMLDNYDLWKAPLLDICKKCLDHKVGEFIAHQSSEVYIDEEVSLSKAIHHLIMKRCQALVVTSRGEAVGLLRLVDVFDQVVAKMKACKI